MVNKVNLYMVQMIIMATKNSQQNEASKYCLIYCTHSTHINIHNYYQTKRRFIDILKKLDTIRICGMADTHKESMSSETDTKRD